MEIAHLGICGNGRLRSHDSLTYIDNISEEERKMVDDLIRDEMLRTNSIDMSDSCIKDNNIELVTYRSLTNGSENSFLDTKSQFSLARRGSDSEFRSRIESVASNEKESEPDSLKDMSKAIQYNNLHMSNLQLLKENGEILWERQRERLTLYKKILDNKKSRLERKLKSKKHERKANQVRFYEDHLSPLLADIERLRRENAELFSTIISKNKTHSECTNELETKYRFLEQ